MPSPADAQGRHQVVEVETPMARPTLVMFDIVSSRPRQPKYDMGKKKKKGRGKGGASGSPGPEHAYG